MKFQSLHGFDKKLKGELKRSPKASLSTLYSHIRNDQRSQSFGDYPILTYTLDFASQHGRQYNRKEILYALNKSPELSEERKRTKSQLLDNLQKLSKRNSKLT
jgi:hypothetical protein